MSLWSQDPTSEWDTWATWQAQRDDAHFAAFAAYSTFFRAQPDSFFPPTCVTSGPDAKYYWYALGVFAPLVVADALTPAQTMSLATSLLTTYDSNKGYTRLLRGDPPAIAHVRSCVNQQNLALLRSYDYTPYAYDVSELHAHTVAQFSLSSLLLRLLAHALHRSGSTAPRITVECCKAAYDRKTFCKSLANVSVASFWDPHADRPFMYGGGCSRWAVSAKYSCSLCRRLSETLWGHYHLCLDCYKTKACYVCGDSRVASTNEDGFPRCQEHPE